jgi:hypothetical protein
MPNDRLYTVGDARAELHRILDQTKPARQVLHRALGAMRKVGEQSGFAGEADKAVEMLRRGALGEAAPPPSRAADPSLAVDITQCRVCGLRYNADFTRVDACPACALAEERRPGPRWVRQLLHEARKKSSGFYPLVLEKEILVGTGSLVEIREQPQVIFRPELLLIDEEWTDGGVIEDIYAGKDSLRNGGGALPMSMFCPTKWGDPSLMAKAKLQGRTVSPGETVRLLVRVTKPGTFRAVFLGPAVLPEDVCRPGALWRRLSPPPSPAAAFLLDGMGQDLLRDPPYLLTQAEEEEEFTRDPVYATDGQTRVGSRPHAYGVMNAKRKRILQRALQYGDGAACAKLADAFESEGLPKQAAVLREAASARSGAPKDDPKIPAPLPHVGVQFDGRWVDPSRTLPTRARELPCPKCGSAQATRSHCPACGWEVCKADVVAVSIEPRDGEERVRFLRPEAEPVSLYGFLGAVTSVRSQTFTLNGVPLGRLTQREVHDAYVVAYSLPGDRVFLFKNRWSDGVSHVLTLEGFKAWRRLFRASEKFLLDEEPI